LQVEMQVEPNCWRAQVGMLRATINTEEGFYFGAADRL
jgi:hypothetical protein